MSRLGQTFLWLGGFLLAGLMGYTLTFDHGLLRRPHLLGGPETVDVCVFYPDRALWVEFRQGIDECVRKGLGSLVETTDNTLVVQARNTRRRIRFDLHDVRGVLETKDQVRALLDRSKGPVAIVGSSNTVLTEAIAQVLGEFRGASREKTQGPVLLIPWASTVLSERPEAGGGPVALLDLDPGRTFRFCPNTQNAADMLIRCVVEDDDGKTPARAVIVEDRHDPFSVDLARSFHRAVEKAAPSAEVVEKAEALLPPILHDFTTLPDPAEEALASSIWADADALPEGKSTWVLLPLQEEPTRGMLNALRRRSPPGPRLHDRRLNVVCGDGIGFSVMEQLAGQYPFPIWCSSPASAPAAVRALGKGVSPDTQVPSEIVAALLNCLDRDDLGAPTADKLRDALASLKFGADHAYAMGRSLAFSRSGERLGDDLGHVLMTRPDRRGVFSFSRKPNGGWSEPEPIGPVVASP